MDHQGEIMKTCINWNRIVANAGIAFFTTLTATQFTSVEAGIYAGILTAGLVFFTELKTESDKGTINRYITKVQRVINTGLVL